MSYRDNLYTTLERWGRNQSSPIRKEQWKLLRLTLRGKVGEGKLEIKKQDGSKKKGEKEVVSDPKTSLDQWVQS